MNKVEKLQCERLCLAKPSGFQTYGIYIYNEDKTKLSSVTDYYNERQPNINVIFLNDGKPCIKSRHIEVLNLAQVIDEVGFDDAKKIFKSRIGEKAFPYFHETILAPSVGAGLEIDELNKANQHLMRLQIKVHKPKKEDGMQM